MPPPSVLACPHLPCEGSQSADHYRSYLRKSFAQYFPTVEFQEVLPSEKVHVSRFTKNWLRYVSHPRQLRKEVQNRAANRPVVFVEVHSSGNLCRIAHPNVVFCHDLASLELNALPPLQFHSWYWRVRQMKQADWVVNNSEHTRRLVVEKLGIPENRTSVNYLGLSEHFRPRTDASAANSVARKIESLGPNVFKILHIAYCAPRKNLPTLLKAVSQIRNQGIRVKLIRAGTPVSTSMDAPLLDALNLRDDILELGQLSHTELPDVYRACDALSFPSLVEGFGWPTIEAQACGLPVVLSDIPCFREVGARAALYHSPLDADALATHLLAIHRSRTMSSDLIEKGFTNAKRFDWKMHCDHLLEIFEKVTFDGSK